jgi:D-serine deaminase-like pyridoxal phosphate-dependent protein
MERYIGLAIEAVPGPALVILHEALIRNLDKMAAFCATQHDVKLRPHAKTHKSARIAAMQIERGAVGVCVQKLSEAEALAAQGIRDIFISNEIVNPAKLARVAALAQHIRLALAVDSEPGIEMLSAAVAGHRTSLQVIVEVNVGQDRCGVAPSLAGMLARKVVQSGLAFAGIHAYHGKAQHIVDPIERAQAAAAAAVLAKQARLSVESEGISCPLITGAGTGTFFTDAARDVFGEIQPGSYVFMDRDYGRNRLQADQPVFEPALFVKTQVISRSPTHAVVDAGHKAHSIDSGMPGVWKRELDYSAAGDEHGILLGSEEHLPALGETVWLVPGHCDPTVNLHDHYIVVEGGLEHGTVVDVWPTDARGCLV